MNVFWLGHGINWGSGSTGASYGGRGGRRYSDASAPLPLEPHGDIFSIGTCGSGGGENSQNQGGRGGGRIEIDVDEKFTLRGKLDVSASSATVIFYKMFCTRF